MLILKHLPDETLVWLAARGDQSAFGELYERYWPKIVAFCQARLQERVGEDLANETFTELWSHWGDNPNFVKSGLHFRHLLYYHARLKLLHHWRTNRGEASLEALSEVGFEPKDLAEVPQLPEVTSEQLRAAMNQLHDSYKEALLLRFEHGFSNEEIAEIVEKSEGAVRLLIHRGLNNLKGILEPKT